MVSLSPSLYDVLSVVTVIGTPVVVVGFCPPASDGGNGGVFCVVFCVFGYWYFCY